MAAVTRLEVKNLYHTNRGDAEMGLAAFCSASDGAGTNN